MIEPYSTAQLEAMATDLESDLVERKESLRGDAPKKIREAVCAFANDLPNHRRPGVVFVGLRDDEHPTGTPVTDRALMQLADMKTDGNIVPPPTLFVSKQRLGNDDVAAVVVHPSDSPPVRYQGRIWVRTGSRRTIASAQDERILNEKRRHGSVSFDVHPVPTASLADLNMNSFRDEYLPGAVDRTILKANERSTKEQLSATKMIVSTTDPTPTVMGILVLGIHPQDFLPGAYVQFLRLAGSALSDPVIDETRCDGALVRVIQCLEEKLAGHNRTAVDIASGPREKRRSTYPMVALRQLAYNAVMHRTYESTNAPVRVCWFDDRIEINSPGGPYGAVTADSFGQAGLVDYRNPNLAEAMRALGWVQRYGVGIDIARRALRENDQPEPEFRSDPNWLFCTVRSKS